MYNLHQYYYEILLKHGLDSLNCHNLLFLEKRNYFIFLEFMTSTLKKISTLDYNLQLINYISLLFEYKTTKPIT